MPKTLRFQIEAMPRQAVYTLASREAPLEKKRSFVESYKGQTKAEVLTLIRQTFPLDEQDKRRQNDGEVLLQTLKRLYRDLKLKSPKISRSQKEAIRGVIEDICQIVEC